MSPHRAASLLLVAAALLFTIEVSCVRLLGERVGHGQILLFRSGAQLMAATLWVILACGAEALRTERLGIHLLRGVLSALSWWLYYMSFRTLDLALATTLSFSSQVFVVILAGLVLGERMTGPRIAATVVGFAGIACAVRVWDIGGFDAALGFGIASSLCGAVMVVITRSLSQTERTPLIMLFMGGIVFLTAAPQAALDWKPLARGDLALLCAVGAFGTTGTWLMVEAYRRAEASALAPIPYLRLLFSIAVGVLVFQEAILPATVIGAALIVGSSLYLIAAEERSAPSR